MELGMSYPYTKPILDVQGGSVDMAPLNTFSVCFS